MKKTLNFKKETVANLNSNELKQLQGGATFDGQACANTVEYCIETLDCALKTVKKYCITKGLDCVSFHTEQNTCFNCLDM